MERKIRVLVADDQVIVAEGLCALLAQESDIEVIGHVSNGEEVLNVLGESAVDVVLMDIRMPVMNGVEGTRQVIKSFPDTRVLILTTFDDDTYIRDALAAGASGYMLKDLTAHKLSAAIRNVYLGNAVMHQSVTRMMFKFSDNSAQEAVKGFDCELTPRELEVLKLVGQGLTNGEIASKLFLSNGTVKNYVTILYDKLEVHGRTKLMRLAARHHLENWPDSERGME